MYEGNHPIDKPNIWTEKNIETLFIFCLLDRGMPYSKVCRCFDGLETTGLTQFEKLKEISNEDLVIKLKEIGLRFPNQTGKYLKYNVEHFTADNLYSMSRDELRERIHGFGFKLASMFHNRLHGSQFAIIDTHINNFLKERGCQARSYLEKEKFFQKLAEDGNITPEELDWKIWNERRRK